MIKSELQKWQRLGFTSQQVQEWVNAGLKPTDYNLAFYVCHTLGYQPAKALDFADLATLRIVYQESLSEQFENLQIQPIIRLPGIEREIVPEVPPQNPTLQEEIELVEALILSLGLSDDDGDTSSSSSSEEEEELDQRLEQYLSEKRLDLKKYFVFNLGQEVKIKPKITVSDESGEIVSEPIPNIRQVKPLLTDHLTQLFKDGHEKSAISFTGKNTNQPSQEWNGDRLDRKIANGEEVYIVFDKSKIEDNPRYINKGTSSITQFGELWWDEIIALAMEARPHVRVFQSKKNTLKFLKQNDPALSGKRNLYEWLKDKEQKKIGDVEKERLVKIGVDDSKDSLDRYKSEELSRILKYEEIAKQNADKLPVSEGEIKKLIFFSPPSFQDKDCAIVVGQKEQSQYPVMSLPLLMVPSLEDLSECSGGFKVWLLVYEAPWKNIGNNLYVKQVKSCSSLEEAEKEADKLVEKLMNKNNPYPTCAVFEKVGDVFESSFPDWSDIEGTKGFVTPWNAKDNPEGYFKPLDIVRMETFKGSVDLLVNRYSHVGVYLGKNKNGNHKIAQVTSEPKYLDGTKGGAYIDDWKELFDSNSYDLSRYHSFVTYKRPRLIRRHIARAYLSREYNGSYALLFGTSDYKKGNCQQFANRTVLGLNISNEGTFKKKTEYEPLKNEILNTNRHFNSLSIIGNNRRFYHSVSRGIRGFAEQADDRVKKQRVERESEYTTQIVQAPQWKWNRIVELSPKENCKVQ